MKRITITLTATIIILFFFTGCKKDFRDQWVGDWDFVVVRDCWTMGEPSMETYHCLGTISYGNAFNQLYVEYQNISLLNKRHPLNLEP